MTPEFMVEVSKQLGALEQTVKAAHERVDDINTEIKKTLDNLSTKIQELNEHMVRSEDHGEKIDILMTAHNESKGAKAVLIVFGTLVGSLVTACVGYILK